MSPLLLQWRGQAGGGWLLWGLPGAGDRRNSGQDGSGCTPNLSLPKKGVKPAGVMADPPPPTANTPGDTWPFCSLCPSC